MTVCSSFFNDNNMIMPTGIWVVTFSACTYIRSLIKSAAFDNAALAPMVRDNIDALVAHMTALRRI